MPNDLVELARICATHSQASPHPDVAVQLMRMAKEYQSRAAEIKASRQTELELDELFRKLFDILPSPECLQILRSAKGAALDETPLGRVDPADSSLCPSL
jgi:hypothetical protein